MKQRERRQVVALHQREGRARDFERLIAGEIADHCAGRRGLAGAEVARQRDDIAGADQQREVGHQMRGRHLACERHRECRGLGHSAALRCAWATGNSQVTVVPRPTIESTRTLPPCSSTKDFTNGRPRPAPRCCEPLEWLSNQSNTLSLTSAGIPGPESLTARTILCPVRLALTVIAAFCGENPTAFERRLYRICLMRFSSPVNSPISESTSVLSSMCWVASRS